MALVKIVSGPKDSGKTTYVKKLVDELRTGGKEVSGFISEAVNSRKDAYQLVNLSSGESFPAVGSRIPQGAKAGVWVKYSFSRFFFNSKAFSEAAVVIRNLCLPESGREPAAVIIDELGPLELAGGGFLGAVEELLLTYRLRYCGKNHHPNIILVVRAGLVKEMISKLGLEDSEYELVYTD